MPLENFTLDTLGELDFGRIKVAFDAERERVVKDCMDRPGDDRPRQVSINFKMRPVSDDPSHVDCDKVQVECEITSTVPKRRTKVYTMSPNTKGELRFDADSPDDPDAPTLFDGPNEKDGKSNE